MYHPQGASLAGGLTQARKGTAVSVFVGAGTIGFALGPIFVSYYITLFTAERLYIFGLSGVLIGVALWLLSTHLDMSAVFARQRTQARAPGREKDVRNVVCYFVINSIINTAFRTFLNFVPMYLSLSGKSLTLVGLYGSLLIGAGSIGGLVGGWLSDRIGPKRVAIAATVLPGLFFGLFMFTTGGLSMVGWIGAGFFSTIGNSCFIVAAQESLPGKESLVSSLIMGVSWGVAGIVGILSGFLADFVKAQAGSDALGLQLVLRGFVFVFLLGLPFVLLLDERTKPHPLARASA
jgi:MFS transporter, FSR family, fosmidomycin resistance protein